LVAILAMQPSLFLTNTMEDWNRPLPTPQSPHIAHGKLLFVLANIQVFFLSF